MSRLGRVLTGVIALATGQNFAATLARNALALPLIASLLLLVIGWVFNSDPTSHAGWAILLSTIAAWALIGLIGDALRGFPPVGKRGWTLLVLRLLLVLGLVFAAFSALYWGLPG
jgi:hypothetical protein